MTRKIQFIIVYLLSNQSVENIMLQLVPVDGD